MRPELHDLIEPDLTPQQRAAVEHGSGPARVLAGAGTGKTTVIVRRFAHLVARGVPPEGILVLTFSREAARGLRDAILPGLHAGTRLWVSTFHSFCLRLLESEQPAARRLVQGPEALVLLQGIAAAGIWQWYRGPLAAQLPGEALTLSAQAKDYLLSPADVAHHAAARGDARLADLALAYERFQAALAASRAATFSDFIDRAVDLLAHDPAVAARWRDRFAHILVDEFQDTNLAQFRVLQHLSGAGGNLMVVGDDDQAIYGFRGATDRFILNFADHFPAATYPVEENFRCPAPVLAVANALIAHNAGRVPKALFTTTKLADQPAVQHWQARTGREEGEAVAVDIARRLAAGVRPEDIAVLCRSVRHDAEDLLAALRRRAIPHRVIGGEREHPAVAQTLALLRLTRGLGTADLLAVLAGRMAPADLHAALSAAGGDLPGLLASGGGPAAFAAAVADLQAWLAARAGRPLPHLVYEALLWLGHLRLSLTPSLADIDRLAAVRGLQERAAVAPDLEALLATAPGAAAWVPQPAVAVLTVHAAKGLQWPLVYVIGLVEGRFPVALESQPAFYAAAAIRASLDGGAAAADDPAERLAQHLREERRLAYVALTRAARELILVRARQYGDTPAPPSRFLAEMAAPAPVDVSAAPADPLPQARDYLLQVAVGAEVPEPGRIQASVRLLATDPAAVPLRRQAEPAPFSPGDSLSLSATALELYRDCPRKYYYAQVMGLPDEDNVHLAFGEAVHGALERYNGARREGAVPEAADLSAWFEAAFDPTRCETAGQHAQLRARGEVFLRRYHGWAAARPHTVLAAEQAFDEPYTDRAGRVHRVRGRIDLMLQGSQGVEIVDYKTGHRKSSANTVNKRPTGKSDNDPQRKLQLGLYYLAHFGGQVVPGARATYIFLRHPEDRPPAEWVDDFDAGGEQVVGCEHTAQTLQGIRDRVDAVIDGILTNRFERDPAENKCRWCPFRQPCEASAQAWY